MKEFTYILKEKNGLHARPAGQLSTVCKSFDCEITVIANGKAADGKRLLSLMALGAKCGEELLFKLNGNDEDAAAIALKEHCESNI